MVVFMTSSAPSSSTTPISASSTSEGSLASGIVLRDGEGNPIGSIDADEFFDGSGCFDGSTCLNAEIRVDGPCPGKCEPGVDTDGDGFNDDLECYLPTDQDDDCPNNPSHDAWPLDVDMSGDVSITGDVFHYVGRVGTEPGDAGWWQRLDLDMSGDISITGDVFLYVGVIGVTCS